MCSFIYKDTNKSQNGSYNMMIFLGTGQVGFVPGKKHNIKTDPPDYPEALKAHSMVNGSALHFVLKLTQAHSEPWTSIPPYCHTLSHFHKYDNRRGTAGCCFRGNNSTMILTLSRYRDDILLYTERSSAHLLMD